jgi:hypothetical protein
MMLRQLSSAGLMVGLLGWHYDAARPQGGSNRHTESDDYKDKAGGNQQKLPLESFYGASCNHIPYNGCFQS